MIERLKYNNGNLIVIILCACLIPFIVSEFVLFTQVNSIKLIPNDIIINNFVGPWSSILTGVLTILMVHIVIEVERESSLLDLYRAYKRHWIKWVITKTMFVMTILSFIFILNSILTSLVLYQVLVIQGEQDEISAILMKYNLSMLYCLIFTIPSIVFQIYLSVRTSKVIIASVIGIILMIVGIPIANLTNLYIIPYNFPIFTSKESVRLFDLALVSVLIILSFTTLINKKLSQK